jgi:hypothetical protein
MNKSLYILIPMWLDSDMTYCHYQQMILKTPPAIC